MVYDENSVEECINKGSEVEDEIKTNRELARRAKLGLSKEFKLMARQDQEMASVKRKYKDLQKNLFTQRNSLIQSIPNFWSTSFLKYIRLKNHLTEEDEKIIKFLNSVHVEDGQITFLFDENPYFENTSLIQRYSHAPKENIINIKGTNILWKKDMENTTGAENLKKSFFTRFFDPQHKNLSSKKFRKEVIVAIEEHLWKHAFEYFPSRLEEVKIYKIALDELEIIQKKLREAYTNEYRQSIAVEQKFEKKALPLQVGIQHMFDKVLQPLYQKRNEIVKAIPNFWLLAFLSHYALGNLIRDEDQKIFRLVDSMEVEDDKDGVSGYTITLKFNDKNRYFTNQSLTKRISFCKDGTTNLSAVKIDWKIPLNIATEFLDDTLRIETSFFTWFCAPQVLGERYNDEVSELIKDELWPNALEYFVNGSNKEDEQPKRHRGMPQLASI